MVDDFKHVIDVVKPILNLQAATPFLSLAPPPPNIDVHPNGGLMVVPPSHNGFQD